MKTFTRGQKTRLSELTASTQLQARLEVVSNGLNFDFSCFGLDEAGQLSDDRYFIFYNQQQSPDNEIKLSAFSTKDATFYFDLTRLPASVRRLVFVATIDGTGSMNALSTGRFKLSDRDGVVAEFSFAGGDFTTEKAVMVAEIYFKGEWRVAANGQGFAEGLNAVLRHFGGEEIEEAPNTPVEAIPQAAPPKPIIAPPVPAVAKPLVPRIEEPTPAPAVSPLLKKEKVVLDKKGNVSIAKARTITATLEWEKTGDLDLYCFYIDTERRDGKIYYRNLGSLNERPFIKLDGDSREPGRETIVIARPDRLKYALFAAYSAVGNGVGSFKSYKPKAIITDDLGQSVTVPLMEKNMFSYWVAITLLDFSKAEGNVVKHVESYSRFAEERSPLLYPDGTFKMNVGPIEFK